MMQLQSTRSWNSVLIEQNLIFFGFRAQSQEEVSEILYYRLDDVVRKKKKLDSGSFVLSVFLQIKRSVIRQTTTCSNLLYKNRDT